MRVVFVNGSPKSDGNITALIELAAKEVEKKGGQSVIVRVQKALLSCKQPFCTCCSTPCNKSCYAGTYLEEAFDALKEADFIVFASPVYFGTMSGQMKCFFDKMRAMRAGGFLCGKRGAAISVGASISGGQETTIRSLHDAMLIVGMTICGDASCSEGPGHYGVRARQPASEDAFAKARLLSLVERIFE